MRRRRGPRPRARGRSVITSRNGSKAPVLRSPACNSTIVGASWAAASTGSSAAPVRPFSSTGMSTIERSSQAQQAQRTLDRAVPLVPRHDADRRRADEPLLLDVPALPGQDRVAGCGQTGHVRHLAARHEREARGPGQAQQLEQPAAAHLLDDRRGRRHRVHAGVLVPGGREPVGGERRRDGAADHPAEEPAPRAASEPIRPRPRPAARSPPRARVPRCGSGLSRRWRSSASVAVAPTGASGSRSRYSSASFRVRSSSGE